MKMPEKLDVFKNWKSFTEGMLYLVVGLKCVDKKINL